MPCCDYSSALRSSRRRRFLVVGTDLHFPARGSPQFLRHPFPKISGFLKMQFLHQLRVIRHVVKFLLRNPNKLSPGPPSGRSRQGLSGGTGKDRHSNHAPFSVTKSEKSMENYGLFHLMKPVIESPSGGRQPWNSMVARSYESFVSTSDTA